LLKKKPATEKTIAEPEVADPFDFSTLEAGIATALDRLKYELSKLGTGGRFNPAVLESLRVNLEKDGKVTERLGDLAQVLPKGGRSVMLLVGEKEVSSCVCRKEHDKLTPLKHIKPIISAIQGSKDLNLQPVQDVINSSQLNIPIPPPTKESRDLALAATKKAGEGASLGVKNARAVMQKRLRAMELSKVVRPDDLKKAHKEMEKLVEKGTANVKQTVEAARKAMEKA
jgi:ribosome recycling factor